MMRSTVLIAEDEPLLCFTLSEALVDAGYDVLVAHNATIALNFLQEEGRQFAIVVTDIRMPGEGDGWDVGRRARELYPALPVIYMTGDSEAAHSVHGVSGSLLLKKPFTLSHAIRIIGRMAQVQA